MCADLLRRATQDDFFVVACPILLGEVQEVLHRPKFRRYLTETEADQFVQAVGGIAELHPDPDFEHGLTPDPDDDYLLGLAQAAQADVLVSGDRALLHMESAAPHVVSPRHLHRGL